MSSDAVRGSLRVRLEDDGSVSIQTVEATLAPPDSPFSARPAQIADVIRLVADFYRVPAKLIMGVTRRQEVVEVRQVAMYLSRSLFGASFPRIGRAFGGRHHTTVMAAVERVEAIRAGGSPRLEDHLRRLTEAILKGTPWSPPTEPPFIPSPAASTEAISGMECSTPTSTSPT